MIEDSKKLEDKRFCECGCGRKVSKGINHHTKQAYRFIQGHHPKHPYKIRKIRTDGYITVLNKGHRRALTDGYVREHIFNFERYYDCCLLPWGVIHHIDGNRANNNISNLEGMTNSRHMKTHNLLKSKRYSY